MDYQILSYDNSGSISLSSGDNPERVQGLASLVQEVLIELLSDFDPRTGRGSNLMSDINNVGIIDPDQFKVIAANAINSTKSHVQRNQSRSSSLSEYDRLADLQYISASVAGSSFSVAFRLVNVANQQLVVQVPV